MSVTVVSGVSVVIMSCISAGHSAAVLVGISPIVPGAGG